MLYFSKKLVKMGEIHAVKIYQMFSMEEAALGIGVLEVSKMLAMLSKASPLAEEKDM